MRVIVTGGTGFIGSNLAKSLAASGDEVLILSRNPAKHQGVLPAPIKVIEWDAQTGKGWSQHINADTTIVNLTGEPIDGTGFIPSRWTAERRSRILNSRLKAGQAMIDAIESASAKPRALIQSSAVGYYGYHADEVLTEDAPPGDDFVAQVAVQWEASTIKVEEIGIRRPVIRTGLALDPKDGVMPRLMLPFHLFAGGPMGSGKQWYSWIHIADEVGAIRFLIHEEGTNGPFNMTAPNPVINKEFARILGAMMGRPSFLPVPPLPMRAAMGEVADLALKGQRVIPDRLLKSGYDFKFPQLVGALRDLLNKK
jgi:uncharacterized protein